VKWFNSIQGRIYLIFIAFALLIVISVGATFWAIQTQEMDALVINLAGRQRMLTQKITWLAIAQPENPELQASLQLFEQTLSALRDGGAVQYGLAAGTTATQGVHLVTLPPAPDPELRGELDEVARSWADFRHHLKPLDVQALQDASPDLLAQLDLIVGQYESRAEAKLRRVQAIQGLSLLVGLALLSWGFTITHQRIFTPLVELGVAARRMANGQLSEPVPPMGADELGELGGAFEAMRAEIASAQESLEGRVAQRTRELMAAFEFSQEIVSQLELERLLRSVTERARSLMSARAAALCLLENGDSGLILSASSPEDEALLNIRQTLEGGLAHCVVHNGGLVLAQAECQQCAFLQANAPGQSAVVPLRAAETTLGALCVVREPGQAFDPDETRALTLLSNAAAIAIANARLVETGRQQTEQAAILSERERLAAELHDNLAQTLSFLNLEADQMKGMLATGESRKSLGALEQMKSAIGGAYEQVRAALVGLSEPVPGADDFAYKLNASLEEMRRVTFLPITLEIADSSALALPRLVQAQAIHIVREALVNTHKHAQARSVRVCIERVDGQSRFTIEDDGCGFDPQDTLGSHHLGMRLMRARAERIGGTLMVESAPGAGTRVVVSFPLTT
jgi:two-component system nitrate/nitrite sensor histidine kinase NarX